MNALDLIAWLSLALAVVGIVLFIRRLILWSQKKKKVIEAVAVGVPTILIVSQGKQMGPYTRDEAVTMVQNNAFAADSLYWEPGMMDWQPVKLLETIRK